MQDRLRRIVLFWFGTIMAAAFLCCGFVFLFTNFLIDNVPPPNRIYLGLLFLLYAAYRMSRQYRLYVRLKHGRHD